MLLYTSRTVAFGRSAEENLSVARTISAALVSVVRHVVAAPSAARPAWIVAKGGITAHDIAVHGLGIRRAEVAGQLYLGVPAARCGSGGGRRALRRLPRQRRRRRSTGAGRAAYARGGRAPVTG